MKNRIEAECWNCKFFEYDGDENAYGSYFGRCRRYPPVPISARYPAPSKQDVKEYGGTVFFDFPVVGESYWCGEFFPSLDLVPREGTTA